MRAAIRRHLQGRGWYVRKTAGLHVGVDLIVDLKRLGIKPNCVLDVGAHHGQTALEYAKAFPGCCVFAFEPAPDNFAKLKRAASWIPEIVPINLAVSDQSGPACIRIDTQNSQGHSLVPAMEDHAESVDAITIDDYCAIQRIFPDFIKIDTEGFELRVIAGARHTLAKSPRAVLAEATLNPYNTRHTQLADLTAALMPYEFRLAALYDQCRWASTRQLEFFNALFIRPREASS